MRDFLFFKQMNNDYIFAFKFLLVCYNSLIMENIMARTKDEIMENFVDLACDLSPENLWCDGEASGEEVEEKLKSINESWKDLETEIGHKVTEDDAWNWHSEQRNQFIAEQTKKTSDSKTTTKKKNFFGT